MLTSFQRHFRVVETRYVRITCTSREGTEYEGSVQMSSLIRRVSVVFATQASTSSSMSFRRHRRVLWACLLEETVAMLILKLFGFTVSPPYRSFRRNVTTSLFVSELHANSAGRTSPGGGCRFNCSAVSGCPIRRSRTHPSSVSAACRIVHTLTHEKNMTLVNRTDSGTGDMRSGLCSEAATTNRVTGIKARTSTHVQKPTVATARRQRLCGKSSLRKT